MDNEAQTKINTARICESQKYLGSRGFFYDILKVSQKKELRPMKSTGT